jgi:hypothetical protein
MLARYTPSPAWSYLGSRHTIPTQLFRSETQISKHFAAAWRPHEERKLPRTERQISRTIFSRFGGGGLPHSARFFATTRNYRHDRHAPSPPAWIVVVRVDRVRAPSERVRGARVVRGVRALGLRVRILID